MAAGFIHIDVQAQHEGEPFQRCSNALAVRRRQDRIGRDADDCLDLAGSGRFDFLGQAGDREFTENLGRA